MAALWKEEVRVRVRVRVSMFVRVGVRASRSLSRSLNWEGGPSEGDVGVSSRVVICVGWVRGGCKGRRT